MFRDFLEENFLLWATISCKATPCLGRITLRPVDIQFFSPKRRTLGFFHSSVMDIVASRRHTDAAGKDGIIVEFSLGDK